jgi:hypothetical protein
VLASFKLSIGRRPPSRLYRIQPIWSRRRGQRIDTARSNTSETATIQPTRCWPTRRIPSSIGRDSPKLGEAIDWLQEMLFVEPVERVVLAAAEKKGINEHTLQGSAQARHPGQLPEDDDLEL